ncbi:hypothetical protein [Legionella feeleii]|uniref:Uncharacterized protein n=1 Tax=Legionella feeleii TaxID=453 RepID=A0A0W0TH55_9GAMM|nr:hypothetical protein [Legionella feeleii]KTC94919.1 hypothetical protein Lfee_2583 [Legionella feeleii]SPX60106.1 Uncharacterised protein [Legionella feeleii]
MNSLIDTAVRKLSEQSLSEQALRQRLEAEFAGVSDLDSPGSFHDYKLVRYSV